jgi:hypothetical protein
VDPTKEQQRSVVASAHAPDIKGTTAVLVPIAAHVDMDISGGALFSGPILGTDSSDPVGLHTHREQAPTIR